MKVKVEKLERVFLFNGVKLPDPSPDFTVEQVRDTYVNCLSRVGDGRD